MKVLKKCPVCLTRQIKFLYYGRDILYNVVGGIFPVFRCNKCSAIFLNPFPTAAETSRYYPKSYYSYETSTSGGFFESVKDKIIKFHLDPESKFSFLDKVIIYVFKSKFSGIPLYTKKNGTFFDIGCGIGSNLKILNNYGWKTYGIELDSNAVSFAKKQKLNVIKTSIENVNMKGKQFDCIRIWHVYEHLTDPHIAMQKLNKLLKIDGEILMALPNTNSWARKVFGSYWYGLDVPRHVIDYSPKTLSYVTRKHNLDIVKIQFSSAGWFLGSLSNLLRAKFGLKYNLINNLYLLFIFSPLDYLSDIFKQGDTIFLTIKKQR